jgi:hypothetical protein
VPIIWTSGSLNLLKPSGPVQAFNGIALPFYFFIVGEMQCFIVVDIRNKFYKPFSLAPG